MNLFIKSMRFDKRYFIVISIVFCLIGLWLYYAKYKKIPYSNYKNIDVEIESKFIDEFHKKTNNETARIIEGGKVTSRSYNDLLSFKQAYQVILNKKSGSDLQQAVLQLIHDAARFLSLEDFQLFSDQLENLNSWRTAIGLLGERFAKEDIEAGFIWLYTLMDDPSAPTAFQAFSKEVEPKHNDRLFEMANNIDHRILSNAILTGIVSQNHEKSKNLVIEMIQINPRSVDGSVSKAIARAYYLNEQYDVALRISQMYHDPHHRSQSINEFFRLMGQRDPVQAAKMLESIKNEQDRTPAMRSIVRPWVSDDPVSSSAWVASLPQGPARDAGSEEIVNGITTIDYRSAFDWAQSIMDNERRERAMNRVMNHIEINYPSEYQLYRDQIHD